MQDPSCWHGRESQLTWSSQSNPYSASSRAGNEVKEPAGAQSEWSLPTTPDGHRLCPVVHNMVTGHVAEKVSAEGTNGWVRPSLRRDNCTASVHCLTCDRRKQRVATSSR